MTRNLLCSTALALLVGLPAAAATMVKDVEVVVDLTAIENPEAALHWTAVADDVENAIVARLVDRIADEGVSIEIDLSEVELSNSYEEALNIADTKLVGDVKVRSKDNDADFKTYQLTVNIDQAIVFMPEGTDVTSLNHDSTEFYGALVSAFADAVVVRLE